MLGLGGGGNFLIKNRPGGRGGVGGGVGVGEGGGGGVGGEGGGGGGGVVQGWCNR